MSEVIQKPNLRFQEFSDEWSVKALKSLLHTYKLGGNYSNSDKLSDRPLIKMGNLGRGNIKIKKVQYINEFEIVDEDDIIKKGDLFFNTRNTLDLVGKVAIWNNELPIAYYNSNLIRFEFDNNFFMNYRLNSYQGIKGLKSFATGTTSVAAIYTKDLLKLKLAIPSIQEQQKIATFLTGVDKKITQLQEKKTHLEQYKKGAMQQLFSQEVRFKPTDVTARHEAVSQNEYPDWEEKKLGSVSMIIMGQSPSSSSYNSNANGTYLVQGNADIKDRITNPRNWTTEPTKLCEIGDLILTVRAPVGAIAKSIHNACIGRGVCAIKNNYKSNIEFLYQYLLSYEDKWIRLEQGSTFTAVNRRDINSIKINLPSIIEQTKIANFLSAIDAKIQLVHTQLKNTQQFKKGLLQQMFV
jgi:type I restriction enzyme S subunit